MIGEGGREEEGDDRARGNCDEHDVDGVAARGDEEGANEEDEGESADAEDDDEGADEQLTARIEEQCSDAHTQGPDDGDDVGADPQPHEELGQGGEHLREEGARVSIEHGAASLTAACPQDVTQCTWRAARFG